MPGREESFSKTRQRETRAGLGRRKLRPIGPNDLWHRDGVEAIKVGLTLSMFHRGDALTRVEWEFDIESFLAF